MEQGVTICQNCKQNFVIDNEDFAFYESMQVPPPTFCPHCRMMRRFLFRSEHYLTRRKEEVEGKEIFAGVPAQSPYKVYTHEYWWGDKWSALDYGRDYDFSRPFFEQFGELLRAVPWCAQTAVNMVNSEYCDQASYLKNVYLGFDIDYSEDSQYAVMARRLKDCCDMLSSLQCELCYEGIMIKGGYKVIHSYNCEDCRDVWFSKNCSGCSNCFGCVNLKKKSYYIFNQPYNKEEYVRKMREFALDTHTGVQKAQAEAEAFWKKYPVKYLNGFRNFGSSGDHLTDTKNAKYSYLVQDAENIKFLQFMFGGAISNSYDYTVWGDAASRMYECLTCGWQVDSLKFCFDCWPSAQNLEYCVSCRSSRNLFGCVGLQKKEYCILNKQYTKESFDKLRTRIIEQMKEMPYSDSHGNIYRYGEFFPPEFSCFSYNQTVAQDFFPLTKEQALASGYSWRDSDAKEYQTTKNSSALPDRVQEVADEITKEIIKCESCNRAYRIIPAELAFYRRTLLPLPRQCWECRLRRRFALLNPPKYYARDCKCGGTASLKGGYTNSATHGHGANPCGAKFETTYSPERPEIVYCESCYQAEVA